jgi:hypothetical protein
MHKSVEKMAMRLLELEKCSPCHGTGIYCKTKQEWDPMRQEYLTIADLAFPKECPACMGRMGHKFGDIREVFEWYGVKDDRPRSNG